MPTSTQKSPPSPRVAAIGEDFTPQPRLIWTALNGDITAFVDYWDEGADYVSVDGRLIKGRAQIQEFFGKMSSSRTGQPQQTAAIDQIRFITPELATVDGSWTITGVRDAQGKKLDPINGKSFEVVQKRHGRWRFVATREMVIFRGD